MSNSYTWPVLTRYDQNHLAKIALPLGGIGTGTVSLGGRGDLRDWEIVNRPGKGFAPDNTFFALYAKPQGGEAVTRVLEGPIELSDYEGAFGSRVRNHGLPRFRECSFEAAYPFGQVLLTDPDVPLRVKLQAFNPLIPGDADQSSIPTAILRFVLTNPGDASVQASICGSLQNFIGRDGSQGSTQKNNNQYRTTEQLAGLFLHSMREDIEAEQWGTMALATTHSAASVTCRTQWPNLSWGNTLLDFWDDFSEDGRLEERDSESIDAPMASLAASILVPARDTVSITFLVTWHFPNRMTWTPSSNDASCCPDGASCGNPNLIGNYYTTQYEDAWDVMVRTAADLPGLEAKTLLFVNEFCSSHLPEVVKEAALYNISTLRTQTCFRTPDGLFFGWEGCDDKNGCCEGSCTHVWNYEQATAFLFGDLSRAMREVEFLHATRNDGHMSFRVHLPLVRATAGGLAAADGQMGCIMKLYRDWKLSGDTEFLAKLWSKARKTLEFCWMPGGWDADQDGVMEGCQHNTMDVEYYGPNPQMGTWYLGALRASEAMADALGDKEFSAVCRDLFERGRIWMDAHLFNGEYYEHQILPAKSEDAVAPGLRHANMGAKDATNPDLQLGSGCLIDQLAGQFMADICHLGPLLDPSHITATLQSLMDYNFKTDLWGHFNHLRTFALGDESAMLMATYPKGRRPANPFPYYNEVMTGFEYTAAINMLYDGQTENGLTLIRAIRARYDGKRRSPFDEAECGHHYARAMASWGAVLALTGFHYDGVEQSMTFSPKAEGMFQTFFSTGDAWGTVRRNSDGVVTLTVHHGLLSLKMLTFDETSWNWPTGIDITFISLR